MDSLPLFVSAVSSEYFVKQQQPNIFWSSSEMKVLSSLHCVASGVSPGRIYGNLYISGWVYFISSCLVRVSGLTCAGDLGGDGVLFWNSCCDYYFGLSYTVSNVSTEALSWDISIGWVVRMDVEDT